ncbi:hypothetical protein BaRGS_00035461 [Batillaria attramentaria]|uniref:Uncharacterized protein n=1 Tax=Batillaria attramentaria TaxID=370345 RepID=A0ABD0JE79_9CAEN
MQETGSGYHAAGEERDHRYKMIADPRGPCLIFNNKTFTAANGAPIPDLPTREGTDIDRGRPVHESDSAPDMQRFIPENTDFLIAHSTLPGYKAFRDPANGSLFIAKLTEVLNSEAHRRDIVKMLTMVNDKLADVDVTLPGYRGISKQASVFQSSLRKDLYFYPDQITYRATVTETGPVETCKVSRPIDYRCDDLSAIPAARPEYSGEAKRFAINPHRQVKICRHLNTRARADIQEPKFIATYKRYVLLPQSETGRIEICQVSRPTDYRCDDLSTGPVARPEYSGEAKRFVINPYYT